MEALPQAPLRNLGVVALLVGLQGFLLGLEVPCWLLAALEVRAVLLVLGRSTLEGLGALEFGELEMYSR